MTYFAEDERYVMTGTNGTITDRRRHRVRFRRETTGKTLIFYKSADTILVDGNEEIGRDQERRALRALTGAVRRR